jgi:hypothetical protein
LTLAPRHCRAVRMRLYRRVGEAGDQSGVIASGWDPKRPCGVMVGRPRWLPRRTAHSRWASGSNCRRSRRGQRECQKGQQGSRAVPRESRFLPSSPISGLLGTDRNVREGN